MLKEVLGGRADVDVLLEVDGQWSMSKFDVLLEVDGQWSVSKLESERCNEDGGAGREGGFIEEDASGEGGRKTSSVHRYASFQGSYEVKRKVKLATAVTSDTEVKPKTW